MAEEQKKESTLLNVSMRGWMTLVITGSVCYMAVMQIPIGELLSNAFLLIIGVYYGQRKST